MITPPAQPRSDDPSNALPLAVPEGHERIRVPLSRFREARVNGHAVRRQLHRLEAAVRRPLLREEHDLVDPARNQRDQVGRRSNLVARVCGAVYQLHAQPTCAGLAQALHVRPAGPPN